MLKTLIIKKDDVVYGESGAGAVSTIATIGALAEGSFAVFTADGQLVSRTGTVTTLANVDFNKPFTLYAMENTELRAIPFFGKGQNSAMPTTAAAAKVITVDVDVFPTSRSELKPTGFIVIDSDRTPHDPKARKRAEVPVDDDVTATGSTNFEGQVIVALNAIDGITASGDGSGNITITGDAGKNFQMIGTGYIEGITITIGTAIAYANTLTAAELLVLERETRAHQGETQHDLMGSHSDMWTKASLVESGLTYYVYYLKYVHTNGQLLTGGVHDNHIMCVASPDSVPGGSDADGTWAALIGAMADPVNNLS